MKTVKQTLAVISTLAAVFLFISFSIWLYNVYQFSEIHNTTVFKEMKLRYRIYQISKENSLKEVTVDGWNHQLNKNEDVPYWEDSKAIISKYLRNGDKVRFLEIKEDRLGRKCAQVSLGGSVGLVLLQDIKEFKPVFQ